MPILTTPHERALTLLFEELAALASAQGELLLGTPGTIAERRNAQGTRFWVRRYSDASGRRQEDYIGIVGDPDVEARRSSLSAKIDAANAAIASVRLLARAGYATIDKKAYFTLASLHNSGLFEAGAFVIGSHAFGALLNTLGVRGAGYATEDVDIARRGALAVSELPSFIEMLRATGIEFFEVPGLNRRKPSTSFAERGGSRLRVDLRVPSPNDDYPVVAVPELKAHAKGLPYLAYLLGASQVVPALSVHGVVMIRIPVPERYAVHKLIVSQLRGTTSSKPEKDLGQAAALFDALAERFPGAIEDAFKAAPKSASRHLTRAMKALKAHLPAAAEAAWDALSARKSA